MRRQSSALGLLLSMLAMLTLTPIASPPVAHAIPAERCFSETGFCISGRFHDFWERGGGLPVFGLPITAASMELTPAGLLLTQYFERERFELHPDKPPPYDVLLGRLGDEVLRQQERDWTTFPRGTPGGDCLWFAATSHTLCGAFRDFWQAHGLEQDNHPGVSFAESLALFGLPLSETQLETNATGQTVITQWFERARLEWHPQNPRPFKVLLGRLGSELRQPAAPADAVALRTLELVNAARQAADVAPLRLDPALLAAARRHSADMAAHELLGHVGSDGSTTADRIRAAGYPVASNAENVAAGYETADEVVLAWLGSPGHRRNLLSPEFTDLGVAVSTRPGSRHVWYWVLTLARR